MDAHIFLFGEIGGWGVDEGEILKQIAKAKQDKAETLIVQISSFGGYVYSGKAIYSALKASGIPVRVEIIGQAFSIASYIAMAGDEILIAEKGEMMIHPAWSFAEGNAEELRKQADDLEKMSEEIFAVYVERGADKDTIRSYFDEERILSASEAIEAGLATGLLTPMKAVAKFNINHNNKKMEKTILENLLEGVNKLLGKTAKNASVTTDSGALYFDGETIAVGTAVFTDEVMSVPAEDGSYVDGTSTYVVVGGSVSEILTEEAPDEEVEALKAEIERLKAEAASAAAEVEAAKAAAAKEVEVSQNELNAFKAELNGIKDVLVQEKIKIERNVTPTPSISAAGVMAKISSNKNKRN